MNPQPQDFSRHDNSELTWEEITRQLELKDEELKQRISIEGKGKISSATYERSKRRLRSSLYETYIKQYLHYVDANEFTIVTYPELLDKAAHDEVFRTLLIKRVLHIIDQGSLPILKEIELKLQNIQVIYEGAEKVPPADGGVTPDWSERRQREIRRNLAQEALLLQENLPIVKEYIKKAEESASSQRAPIESLTWNDGNLKLAFHFRYILSELSRKKDGKPVPETIKEEKVSEQSTHMSLLTSENQTPERESSMDTVSSQDISEQPPIPHHPEVHHDDQPTVEVDPTPEQTTTPAPDREGEVNSDAPGIVSSQAQQDQLVSQSQAQPEAERPSLFKRLFGRK